MLPKDVDPFLSKLERFSIGISTVAPMHSNHKLIHEWSLTLDKMIREYKESVMLAGGAFIAAASVNTGTKKDATGAFLTEAEAYRRFLGDSNPIVKIDNSVVPYKRLEQLEAALFKSPPGQQSLPLYRTFAFFCHGLKNGIQFGVNMSNCYRLADAIAKVACKRITVVLYACSTGADGDLDSADETAPGPGGEGGFADKLRDELLLRGVEATVFAHTTPGHATENPYVRVFPPTRGDGGEWVVEPGTKHWKKWRIALQNSQVRFMFPSLSRELLLEAISK